MAAHEDELLEVARLLLRRRAGQTGRLPSARIRRSISSSYYAIFHFISSEAAGRLVGRTPNLLKRKRILIRTITHSGVRTALDKVKGRFVESSVQEFLEHPAVRSPVAAPIFAQNFAKAFADAQAKREDADYDLATHLTATDALLIRNKVRRAIKGWKVASTLADNDFKNALCALIVMKGRLRRDG